MFVQTKNADIFLIFAKSTSYLSFLLVDVSTSICIPPVNQWMYFWNLCLHLAYARNASVNQKLWALAKQSSRSRSHHQLQWWWLNPVYVQRSLILHVSLCILLMLQKSALGSWRLHSSSHSELSEFYGPSGSANSWGGHVPNEWHDVMSFQ